jgi:hypothetical protein
MHEGGMQSYKNEGGHNHSMHEGGMQSHETKVDITTVCMKVACKATDYSCKRYQQMKQLLVPYESCGGQVVQTQG